MEVRLVSRDLWGVFEHYHYLSSSLPSNSKCYVGFINQEPVCFIAIGVFPHPTNKNIVKVSRVVVLPHWQGYGISRKMLDHIASNYYKDKDVRITTTLPIMHNSFWKNKNWGLRFQGIRKKSEAGKNAKIANNGREVYLETYQFINDHFVDKVSRKNVPKGMERY